MKHKMDIAVEVLLKLIETDKTGFDAEGIAAYAWEITDAMQAEAEKREDKTRPEVLCEVDWRVAPSWAKYWAIREDSDTALWCINKPTITDDCFLSNGGCSPAPSFGFTGSHIVERPQ